MSDAEATKPEDSQKPTAKKPFPRVALGFTILVAALIVLSRLFASEIGDTIGLSPDVMAVCSYLLIVLVMLTWGIWILFLSKRNWFMRIIMMLVLLGLPYGFLKVFRPVNDGDAAIAYFKPIWEAERGVVETEVEASENAIDLTTETPNDFAQFLGPNRNGIVSGQPGIASDAINTQTEVVWKKPVGEGWSGFSARNGYAVTLEQRGDQECVTCYEIATGKMVWIHEHQARHRDAMGLGRLGPRATPTIHNGMVYSMGAMGHFVCLNGADGVPVWSKDMLEILKIDSISGEADGFQFQYEDSQLAWGRSGSPLIVDDLVVVTGGGPRGGPFTTLLAFDAKTGELKWKGGDEMIAYGSPSLATLAGKRQIVVVAETRAMGFDPETGEALWEHERLGSSEGPANCSQVTIVDEDHIILSKGYNMGGELVEVINEEGKFSTESLESNPRVLKTKLTSPVVVDGYAYTLSDGFLECTDVEDLSRKWKRRGKFGHGQILLCGDKLLVHSESGTLFLIKATPDGFEELGQMKTVEGVCWNNLCRFGEYLLVRSELEAACIRLASE